MPEVHVRFPDEAGDRTGVVRTGARARAAPEAAPAPAPQAAPEPAPEAGTPTAWQTADLVPLGRPAVGAAGKRCDACHGEHAHLWRVVVATAAGFEERFLCGTSPACQMASLVPAVKV